MKQPFIWNKEKTECVDLYKIRSIEIKKQRMGEIDYITVKGWYNERDYFDFGTFKDMPEAKEFINEIWK
jgi:hypothetical protein